MCMYALYICICTYMYACMHLCGTVQMYTVFTKADMDFIAIMIMYIFSGVWSRAKALCASPRPC